MFLKQIDKELKEKSKKTDIPIMDGVLIAVSIIFVIMMVHSSFVFFYDEYIMYSLAFSMVIVGFIVIVKKKYSKLPFFGLAVLLLILFIYVFPLTIHHYIFEKKNICFDATLTNKYFSHTSGDIGSIWVTPHKVKNKLFEKIDNIDGIPKYEYDQLPPTGSKIQICGQLSKVGFSYEYIDTVP